jgi:conjugal transfer pilus assembly protein TraV
MQSSGRRRRLRLTGALGLTSLGVLSSCASLGGNVRGSFSCAAPDGICAPSSTIDDRALALISSDQSDGETRPMGNVRQPIRRRTNRAEAGQPARLASADPGRTQEKVLRIVFQPYIDERGRLHEASAVHAVVARGEWQQQALMDASLPQRRSAAAQGTEALADAVDRVDPPVDGFALADPDAPDPAAIAAARARKPDPASDPVSAIKADVRARLAPKAQAAPRQGTAAALSHTPPAAASPVLQPPSGASTGGSPQAKVTPVQAPAALPPGGSGAAAAVRVKADPRYQEVANGAAKGARDAAAQSGAQAAPAAIGATVKAANFPAAVPEDK